MAGRLRAAPLTRRPIRICWSGDTVGQGWGINERFGGLRLYETMAGHSPDLFINSGDLIYADKVDHGFDKSSITELRKRFAPLVRKTQPYTKPIAHRANWVEPERLAEIEYRAKSAEGKVRHPFFNCEKTFEGRRPSHRERADLADCRANPNRTCRPPSDIHSQRYWK